MTALEILGVLAILYIAVMLIHARVAWRQGWPPLDWFKIPVWPLHLWRGRF